VSQAGLLTHLHIPLSYTYASLNTLAHTSQHTYAYPAATPQALCHARAADGLALVFTRGSGAGGEAFQGRIPSLGTLSCTHAHPKHRNTHSNSCMYTSGCILTIGIDQVSPHTHTHTHTHTGLGGGGMGYEGIRDSVALEFDIAANAHWGDPSANHISWHSRGPAHILTSRCAAPRKSPCNTGRSRFQNVWQGHPNSPAHTASLSHSSAIPLLADGLEHRVRVRCCCSVCVCVCVCVCARARECGSIFHAYLCIHIPTIHIAYICLHIICIYT